MLARNQALRTLVGLDGLVEAGTVTIERNDALQDLTGLDERRALLSLRGSEPFGGRSRAERDSALEESH